MSQRFRVRSKYRRYFPTRPNTNQDVLWAISSARYQNAQSAESKQTEYVSEHQFEDFSISSQLKKNIADKKYISPTPIQDKAIPVILAGQDIIGIANTGTGKTGAFLIPLIDKVSRDRAQKVLVIAPTRELAVQIYDELLGFGEGLGILATLCIGGKSIETQKRSLLRNPNFVIGTPGRIKDFTRQGFLNLSQFQNVVLDEADRMVDIGFIGDIKYLISFLSKNRQSLFFSATISGKVKEILGTFVQNPVTISTKVNDTVENITQEVVKVEFGEHKVDKLHDLLIQKEFRKVLIFGRTKWGVQRLSSELKLRGFRAGVIHGNKSQNHRQKTLEMFRQNQISILLATDVASRGLDIEDVSHVINYDMPKSYDDYIHRIGRTGRANKIGTALTFVI